MPFEILNQSEYLMLKLSEECLADLAPSVVPAFQKALEESKLKIAIVNCSECNLLDAAFLRSLAMVYRELKTRNGKIRLVGANEKIQDSVKKAGLDMILVNKISLRGALVDVGLVKQKEIDTNFINPFLSSTMKVFKVQCFTELKPGTPYLKKVTDPLLMGDVSGIISITSETFSGTLAISLTEKIFCEVAGKMMGEKIEKIDEQNVDMVGELANIILGQAKVELNQIGYRVEMALPSCVWGKDHKIKHFGGGVCVVIPFESDFGTIYSEIMTNNSLLNQVAKKAA